MVPRTDTREGSRPRPACKYGEGNSGIACHVGLPKYLLGAPLEYLAGNHHLLPDMQPTSLGISPRGMFARVWIFAPPAEQTMDVYGAVVYGPLINIYKLCSGAQPAWPFCCELKANTREWLLHDEQADYMGWRSTVLEEAMSDSGFTYIGHDGVYSLKQSRNSGLLVKEVSPSGSDSKALGVPRNPAEKPCRDGMAWRITSGL